MFFVNFGYKSFVRYVFCKYFVQGHRSPFHSFNIVFGETIQVMNFSASEYSWVLHLKTRHQTQSHLHFPVVLWKEAPRLCISHLGLGVTPVRGAGSASSTPTRLCMRRPALGTPAPASRCPGPCCGSVWVPVSRVSAFQQHTVLTTGAFWCWTREYHPPTFFLQRVLAVLRVL